MFTAIDQSHRRQSPLRVRAIGAAAAAVALATPALAAAANNPSFKASVPFSGGRTTDLRVGEPLEFDRRNVSSTERGELSDATRERLEEWFAPEYDVWRRLADTGEWSGARGTRLAKRPPQ